MFDKNGTTMNYILSTSKGKKKTTTSNTMRQTRVDEETLRRFFTLEHKVRFDCI